MSSNYGASFRPNQELWGQPLKIWVRHRLGNDSVPLRPSKTFMHSSAGRHHWICGMIVSRVSTVGRTFTTKYTYGDLCPNNILVNNRKITVIVDWEFAGCFPEYWEYTKMYYGWRPCRKKLYETLDQTPNAYPEELTAESAIWRVFDTFDYDIPLRQDGQNQEPDKPGE